MFQISHVARAAQESLKRDVQVNAKGNGGYEIVCLDGTPVTPFREQLIFQKAELLAQEEIRDKMLPLSKRQFYLALSRPQYALITEAQALSVIKKTALPAKITEVITSQLFKDGLPSGVSAVDIQAWLFCEEPMKRNHIITKLMIATIGWTEEEGDTFWNFASTI